MKVEILYFGDCPHYRPAIDRVREVLNEEEVVADVLEAQVEDAATAAKLGFLGSPTVRVDGQDIEPAARIADALGIGCRIYLDAGTLTGVPPRELIRAAIRKAKTRLCPRTSMVFGG